MGGLSMAKVGYSSDGDVTDKPSYRMGFIAGLGYEFSLAPTFAIEVDALYHQRGFKYEDKDADYETKLVMKSDVVSVPILAKYRFPGSVAFFIQGGFEVAFVLSSKADVTTTTYVDGVVDSEEKTSEDVKEFTSSMDYGAVFGAGIVLPMGKSKLVIDGRYYLGFANMLDFGEEDASSDDWIRSRSIVLMLGLAF